MGTGAEIRIRLVGTTYRTFYHVDGSPEIIGKQLWHLLVQFKDHQWNKLEKNLREDVTWVEERDLEDDSVRKYKSKYRRDIRTDDPSPEIKQALAKARENPGYALNMVLRNKLRHMVHVDCVNKREDDANPKDVFDHAEFTYAIDFPKRRLQMLNKKDKKWITIPFRHMELFSKFMILDNPSRTMKLLREGPHF
ncbi:hypothetical protein IQ07DRAFT_637545 [Pyrenochaeta sp. DS3sAY3a]|nr:hypothetical protein IQ07DRAFT_637545 [Pyrenochaeta sp. DS3sAY3a]